MPRKQKDVYERISITENKINQLELQIKEQRTKLIALNKEREGIPQAKRKPATPSWRRVRQ